MAAVVVNSLNQVNEGIQSHVEAMYTLEIFNEDKTYKLHELLPNNSYQKKSLNLTHRLREYKLLLVAAQKALQSHNRGEFADFDALVGENSCQIRATILGLLNSAMPTCIVQLIIEISSLLDKVNAEIQNIQNKDLTQETSFEEFIIKNGLVLNLRCRDVFLLTSYLLTKVRILLPANLEKQIVRNESTVTSKIKELAPVGSTFAREIVKHTRGVLSKISVQFVQQAAELLPLPDSVHEMVSEQYVTEYKKFGTLQCLPCFWYTLILMKYALRTSLPLVLSVKQMATDKDYKVIREFQVAYKAENGQFKPVAMNKISENTPIIAVLGSSCRPEREFGSLEESMQEILSRGPMDLILAYAAAHRQYPDENQDVIVDDNANNQFLQYYQSKAQEWGCSLENPELFFLGHVYTDSLGHVLNHIENNVHVTA